MSEQAAINTIESAELSPPAYRTARRLLDLAALRSGHIRIAPDAMRQLAGTEADGTMRRHLVELSGAGIIHYSINGDVWISFTAWSPVITWRAPETISRSQDAPSDPESSRAVENENGFVRAPRDHTEPLHDRSKPSDDHAVIHAGIGGGSFQSNSEEKKPPPIDPEAPARDPADSDRAFALLIDASVGVNPTKAKELARDFGFDELLRHVAAWWPEYRRGNWKAGMLVRRIESCAKTPEIDHEFRSTSLYRRHVPDDPVGANSAPTDVGFYDEPPAPQPLPEPVVVQVAPAPPPPDPGDPWPVMRIEVGPQLNDVLRSWLDASRLEKRGEIDGVAHYEVVLPSGADVRLVESRCLRAMRFSLGSFLKRKGLPMLTFCTE